VNAAAQTRANQGQLLFNQIGCNSCHRRNMKINNPIHIETADTTGGAGIRINLATDNHDPKPAVAADGSMTIEVFSDFKRHNIGNPDQKNFNQIAADQFITSPLWGISDSAPYLHDGRAPTLDAAIRLHAADGNNAKNNFVALSADD